MKTSSHRRLRTDRGSLLLGSMVMVLVMAIAAAGILDYSLNSYKITLRKNLMEQARTVAESEMEGLFSRWRANANVPLAGTLPTYFRSQNWTVADASVSYISSPGQFTTSYGVLDPSLAIARDISKIAITAQGTVVPDAPAAGPGGPVQQSQTGTMQYYKARTKARITHPLFGSIEVRVGRRFVFQNISLFQNAVFYEKVMEFSGPNSDMEIEGDITGNGDVFLGARPGRSMKFADNIYFVDNYNGAANATDGTVHRPAEWLARGVDGILGNGDDGIDDLIDPVYDPNFGDGSTPAQIAARASQVHKTTRKDFVADQGVSAATLVSNYPAAYPDENSVYRAIIAPPPMSGGSPIPEDPTVKANRMYTKAGLRITIDGGVVTFSDASGNNLNSLLAGAISVSETREPITDKREARIVNVTSLNVGTLNSLLKPILDAPAGEDPASVPAEWAQLRNSFNGIVYIHDTDTATGGIRLLNAERTPNFRDQGFTVATNNGLYVQGDYNTLPKEVYDPNTNTYTTSTESNSAAILGDAVTVLSQGWDDSQSNADMEFGGRAASDSGGDTETMIKAAIVSGNTPTSATTNSGGVQNLVRLLENWTGKITKFDGSMAQMFTSAYFTGEFKNQGNGNNVYWSPTLRRLKFDRALAARPPNGAPSSEQKYYRGDYFTW